MSRVVGPPSLVPESGISPGVRHDLQHVLSTLQAVLTVAGSDALTPGELHGFLRTARDEAVHALAVLDSAAEHAGTTPLPWPATGSATTDVDGVLRAVAAAATSAGRTVTVRSRPGLFVPLAHTGLSRVVRNLLTNAAVAAGDTGRVELHAAPVEGPAGEPVQIRLEVHDDGPGFPAGGAHRSGGLGLGIVRSLVLPAGGWLVLGRSPLGGACAAVTLPASDGVVRA
jgi:signal transduction histidine kinase